MPTNKTRTTATEMLPAVRAILFKARKKRGEYAFLTAHQILAALRGGEGEALIKERGRAGGGEGKTYGASSLLTTALRMLKKELDVTFLDTCSLHIMVPAQDGLVNPTGPTLGLYRLNREALRARATPAVAGV